MNIAMLILLANSASTLFMVGLIWFVQVVHYRLFDKIGESSFVEYQNWHQKLTTLVVGPPMLIEAFSTILLVYYPPPGVGYGPIFIGVALLLAIWFSTAFLQVPCHGRLLKQFDPASYRRLVYTNWIRTAAWTARGCLVVWMIHTTITQAEQVVN